MTYRSVLEYARLLATADTKAWGYLPYQLNVKFRGLDLSGVSVNDSGLSHERSHWHSNSGGPDLEKLLRTLFISSSDKVIDIGCGKGGAMLTLAKYPFARIDGIEIAPNLARTARENLRRLRISNAAIFCCDASEFEDLDEYTYFYMYNPFPEIVMRSVTENMLSSLQRRKRKVTLIYKNAVFEYLVLGAGFRKVRETAQTHPHYPPFSVYVTDFAGSTELNGRVADVRV